MCSWMHKKTGKVVDVITHDAFMQCSTAPEVEARFDQQTWTVYTHDGVTYFRLTSEFKERFDSWH